MLTTMPKQAIVSEVSRIHLRRINVFIRTVTARLRMCSLSLTSAPVKNVIKRHRMPTNFTTCGKCLDVLYHHAEAIQIWHAYRSLYLPSIM